MQSVIEVRDLHKSYGDVERLHGISFNVYAGQIFGFIGTNGAGKTTTVEILEGYRPRTSGKVSVLGTDPAQAGRAWRNRIGLVLQESELDPVYTVRETVGMFARYFKAPTSIDRTISAAGLSDKADERIGRLSGGQKRRVDVALGLVGDPEVLFLDEPTTGLDPAARREMWTMIEGLRDSGKTVFLTTHYMDEAQHLSDHIVVLREGSIAAQGSPDELSRQLGTTSVVSFVLPSGVTPAQLGTAIGASMVVEAGLVRFRTDAVQRDLTTLLGWAQRERLELLNLQVTQPSLDDVFVELAQSPHDIGRDGGSMPGE
ncbi:MAG TPA: ABC transporter ATP-binding protein [Acidimicrobiales bacterium]|nr:ABC transporter ATP-binding protein [Acidimicrobiales bacterium]